MRREAKAPSAGSTQATGNSRGPLRRALATRVVSGDDKGSGAPSSRRARAIPVVLALAILALFASAAPASAAPVAAQMETISDVTYTTAQVTGKVSGNNFSTTWTFEYSKDPDGEGWTPGPSDNSGFSGPITDRPLDEKITGLEPATTYFVRLHASSEADAFSPAASPYPSFTTLTADPPAIPGAVDSSEVFSTSAKATGEINRPAKSDDVTCRFEYITDAQFQDNITTIGPDAGFEGATPVDCVPTAIAETGVKVVKAALTGLTPSTTYHLRLVADNAAPGVVTKDAANFTTAPKVATPTVVATDDASEVKYNTAKFTGKVLRPAGADPALNVNCHFEYITDAQFQENITTIGPDAGFEGAIPADCAQNTIKTAGETPVSAKPGGLTGTTKYHFRLVAENEAGSDTLVAANTFTTPEIELPTVTMDPVAGGTFTTAHLSGAIEIDDPGYGVTNSIFQISTDNANWSTVGPERNENAGPGGISHRQVDVTGLQPSTTYYFRLVGMYYNGFGIAAGIANNEVAFSSTETMTTEPLVAPTAEDLTVTDVTATSAHFSAKVNPNAPAGPLSELAKKAFATHWEFVCTPECKNANGNPIEGTVQGEEGAQTVTGYATRLDPNTPYEVTLLTKNGGGLEATAGPEPFPTDLIKPTVKAFPGGSDGKGGYVLQGAVNPNASEVTDCTFGWGPGAPASGGTKPTDYAFQADCSPKDPGAGAKSVTVEAPLTSLNPGSHYQFRLFATNEAGEEMSDILEFTPELAKADPCDNEQQRTENNSLTLPECRAYEMVTPPGKEGFGANLRTYGGGDRVAYGSEATNIAKSGQGNASYNYYVAARTAAGWETIPNLNGSSGSIHDAPSYVNPDPTGPYLRGYSPDLLSSVWTLTKTEPDNRRFHLYRRSPDGTFARIGTVLGVGDGFNGNEVNVPVAISADLSHLVNAGPTSLGPGVYEYAGTGMDQPRRVDLDNSDTPICSGATYKSISDDGRVIVFTACGSIWARVNATTSFNVSASQCDGVAPACNAPAPALFVGAARDGSRVFFTTTQQLVNGDTDQTNDVYACDLPSGAPAPNQEAANPCASLIEVSGSGTEAKVEPPIYEENTGALLANPGVLNVSEDGSTALIVAQGVLADNKDALGEKAVAGDHNLYTWRTDAAHPDGQTAFVGRLNSNDLNGSGQPSQTTPDGRYLVFSTASQLLDTDTDTARDVYRYDVDTGELTRVSTNVFGVAGNGDFDVRIAAATEHNPSATVSDDGTKIVFTTTEALSPADGNAEPDVYLWTRTRVSLISTGSSGSAPRGGDGSGGTIPVNPKVAIAPSGEDVYFESAQALTPADGDGSNDVYDARIGGGFSFAPPPVCSGEKCQPPASGTLAAPVPATAQSPADPGNVKPKICPKGKVLKGNKCVKKNKKHHGKKKPHKKNKRTASHGRGGNK